MSKYITENERYIIETMLKDGKKPIEIADRIGKHFTTVYREIKRGTVILRDSLMWEDKPTYCADAGQRILETRSHNKGVDCKIQNPEFFKRVSYYIKEKRYSPYATVMALKKEFPETVCTTTLYHYIYKKLIPEVKRQDLPYHKTPSKTSSKPRRPSLRMLGAKTIEDRPKSVNERVSYGDWEMDTVVSGRKKSKECLLVLTERLTLENILRKMPDRKAETVIKTLNTLEREIGIEEFKRKFHTITCDNGVEFSDYDGIEKSVDGLHQRTSVYFCHPFCSGERGSNENNNKLIRRFIPKGSNIGSWTDEQIAEIESFMNNYPRKLFGGMSANEFYALLAIP